MGSVYIEPAALTSYLNKIFLTFKKKYSIIYIEKMKKGMIDLVADI